MGADTGSKAKRADPKRLRQPQSACPFGATVVSYETDRRLGRINLRTLIDAFLRHLSGPPLMV